MSPQRGNLKTSVQAVSRRLPSNAPWPNEAITKEHADALYVGGDRTKLTPFARRSSRHWQRLTGALTADVTRDIPRGDCPRPDGGCHAAANPQARQGGDATNAVAAPTGAGDEWRRNSIGQREQARWTYPG
jgi:hypothetical protein